jgi:hypothetical protein
MTQPISARPRPGNDVDPLKLAILGWQNKKIKEEVHSNTHDPQSDAAIPPRSRRAADAPADDGRGDRQIAQRATWAASAHKLESVALSRYCARMLPIISPDSARDGWRAHALDGALLWFQPSTGFNVRWDAPATRAFRRTAPRVVMFGITNRCNLSCHFCSRDLHAGSVWDVDRAYAMLAGLSRAGVLEVAFGGGEPLTFRGFDELVVRLAADTPLALNVTTNGTLLTSARLAQLAPALGELRLSIYDDNPWLERVELLAESGVVFGVNVLISPARLTALPRRRLRRRARFRGANLRWQAEALLIRPRRRRRGWPR